MTRPINALLEISTQNPNGNQWAAMPSSTASESAWPERRKKTFNGVYKGAVISRHLYRLRNTRCTRSARSTWAHRSHFLPSIVGHLSRKIDNQWSRFTVKFQFSWRCLSNSPSATHIPSISAFTSSSSFAAAALEGQRRAIVFHLNFGEGLLYLFLVSSLILFDRLSWMITIFIHVID